MVHLLVIAGLFIGSDAHACATSEELSDILQTAGQAYIDFDGDGFKDAMMETSLMLPCVSEPLTPATALQLHRLRGVQKFGARDSEQAAEAVIAAWRLEPQGLLPETLIPPGHALREMIPSSGHGVPEATKALGALEGRVWFDGAASDHRPTTRATVAQVVDESGAVVTTKYLFSSDPMMPYPLAPVAEEAPVAHAGAPLPEDAVVAERRSAKVPVLAAAGGGIVVSGVLYGAALGAKNKFETRVPGESADEIRAQAASANGLTAGSMAVGIAALGTGATALLIMDW